MSAKKSDSVRQPTDWPGLIWSFIFFWYFSGVTQLLIVHAGVAGWKGMIQASMVTLLWLIPLILFPARARVLGGLIGIVLWASSLSGLVYFLIYGQEFSQSVIFIMFDSNMQESSEYLGHYFSWSIVSVLAAYSIGGLALWTRVRPAYLSRSAIVVCCAMFVVVGAGFNAVNQLRKRPTLSLAISKFEENIEAAALWQMVVGYHQYLQQLDEMSKMLTVQAQIPPLKNLSDIHAGQRSTLVLVIGESTNRQRMSLYGYSRQTTPNLDQLRGQLEVFDHVIAPRPYTIETLEQVLTFADEEHPELFLSTPTVISVMKQAGYKTFWITNQQTMTKRNTMLTLFSKQADEQTYLNNNRDQNQTSQYDEDVLEPFSKVLDDDAPRKLIVVHLLGTHMSYKYRYPEPYDYFKDRTGVPANVTQSQLAFYNAYDNAVRYNDYVVSSLIKRFSETDPNGFLLYLSDHGESVYDPVAPDVLGRNEAAPTRPMYTVPFIVWKSPSWKSVQGAMVEPLEYLARPYSTSHFIHSWVDLAGLRFDEFDPAKSIVNAGFKPTRMLIGNPHDPRSLRDFSLLPTEPQLGSDTQIALQKSGK
ncbi:phosphoethanolamine transferase CptA [Pseudomonas reactans]|jgi:heptose-I-phosphate ethanolaminephosphotransferase|uniref:Phosphoethanolamine transferase CptA n=1 Tax=Pseudomonas reactans TaxID=117680 RepID=A0A7Y8G756_9PSED|nr:phosphoethanolamine transferase CptA [Pseudomonas reactans]NWA45980.1 phosphoethanolamine transferase CptA [Pseudomonas reactans]NWD98309.1 phosphoethanolamine transferase CptA [Pseudomonas reactans]NWE91830.1 phosphoethanolamine transferase CptA [Pseudomonas reactans]